MTNFFSQLAGKLGRVGHFVTQALLLAGNGYAAYLQGGKMGVANYAIGAFQLLLADGALNFQPPKPQA